eukprot:10006207-Prorocentrum_lima.AAC.1
MSWPPRLYTRLALLCPAPEIGNSNSETRKLGNSETRKFGLGNSEIRTRKFKFRNSELRKHD